MSPLGVVNVALTVRDETTGDSLRGARVVIYARDSTTMDEYAMIESLNDTFVVAVPVDYELIVLVAGLSNYAPSTVSYKPIFGGGVPSHSLALNYLLFSSLLL